MPEKGTLETLAEEPSGHPWEATLAMAATWGVGLGGVVFVVGFVGGFAMYPDSNLAPIWGIILGPPAFLVGLVAGALLARSCSWKQSLLLLAGVAMLAALALLSYMWSLRSSGSRSSQVISPDRLVRSELTNS